jgi:hypothetical protein
MSTVDKEGIYLIGLDYSRDRAGAPSRTPRGRDRGHLIRRADTDWGSEPSGELRERHGAVPASRPDSLPHPLTPEQMRQMWDESEIVGYGKSGLVARLLVLADPSGADMKHRRTAMEHRHTAEVIPFRSEMGIVTKLIVNNSS